MGPLVMVPSLSLKFAGLCVTGSIAVMTSATIASLKVAVGLPLVPIPGAGALPPLSSPGLIEVTVGAMKSGGPDPPPLPAPALPAPPAPPPPPPHPARNASTTHAVSDVLLGI